MIDNFLHAYKVVRKLKQRQVSLKYGCLKKPYNLVTFCNASYANLNDGSSQGGLIIFLNGKDGNISVMLELQKGETCMSKYNSSGNNGFVRSI